MKSYTYSIFVFKTSMLMNSLKIVLLVSYLSLLNYEIFQSKTKDKLHYHTFYMPC